MHMLYSKGITLLRYPLVLFDTLRNSNENNKRETKSRITGEVSIINVHEFGIFRTKFLVKVLHIPANLILVHFAEVWYFLLILVQYN